jgi:predicted ATPase
VGAGPGGRPPAGRPPRPGGRSATGDDRPAAEGAHRPDEDIARVSELTHGGPLVTIVGSGGIGKTTVALAVADRLEAEHADGVVVVDLAPVPPGADVRRAVAEAAGVEGSASETIGRVADHLASRPLLLVLDNCEHVVTSVAELVGRMSGQRGPAHVIATSRAPLDVEGEQVWPLGSLGDAGPVLFVERARAAEPRVPWEPTDPQVIELCRRLDNVPLALELAAGQLRRFDLAELIRHLDDRLALRAGRAAGDVPRHATMETAIDWSYQLLDPNEQELLGQLGVFPSWFDVDAVEASAPPLPGADLFPVFGQLVDKSLVVRLPGSGRYRLLETIRMFARDRLDDTGRRRPPSSATAATCASAWSPRPGWTGGCRRASGRRSAPTSTTSGRPSTAACTRARWATPSRSPWAPRSCGGTPWAAPRATQGSTTSPTETCRPATGCGCRSCAPTWARAGATTTRCSRPPRRPGTSSSRPTASRAPAWPPTTARWRT